MHKSFTNKSGRSAMHPVYNMTQKRARKLELIARLTADPAGYTNEQIANHLGCTTQTVVLIRQLPEYQAKQIEVATGVTSLYDQDLRENVDNMRDELKSMIPMSLMQLRNGLVSKDERIRIKAALEVMDREGTLARVSKSSVEHKVIPPMEADKEVMTNLMALIGSAPGATSGPGENSAAANIARDFTSSATNDINKQQTLMDSDPEAFLESVRLDNQKPN
jgi:hypothetical protein